METILSIIIATALTNGISLIISHPLAYLITSDKNQKRNNQNDQLDANNAANSIFQSNTAPINDKPNVQPISGLNRCSQCHTVVLPNAKGTCLNCGASSFHTINSIDKTKKNNVIATVESKKRKYHILSKMRERNG